jgi:hypothetical protein
LLFILIDHNMVLRYNYSNQNRQWWQTNSPHLPAILMATAVRRSNTDGIAQFGVSRYYSGSHWTPASGDYSLCIAPAAARATGKQTTINKYT